MKRYPALAAALLLLAASVTACGDSTGNVTETTGIADTTAALTEITDPGEQRCTDTLTAQDYGGAEFRIYTSNVLAGWELPTTINYAAEESGEVVNDTLFARDRWLEESYNVTVQYTADDSGAN